MLALLPTSIAQLQDLLDLLQGETHGFGFQDEAQPIAIGLVVEPVTRFRALRLREEAYFFVVAHCLRVEI